MLVERLKSQGVLLAVNGGKLVVDTPAPLTDEQRDYIRDHKPQLMAELKSVAANDEASVVTRLKRIAKERNHPLSDLLDWYKDDLPDLAAMSSKDFRFVVTEYLNNLEKYKPANRPHTVQCISCQHFTRSSHPHLGRCGANVAPPNCGLFWDTDSRGCGKFIEADQPAGETQCS